MKRTLSGDDLKMKKAKLVENDRDSGEVSEKTSGSVYLDDNLLFEVLKHVDARSMAMAACVSKQWQKTAQDERLWELICTKQWANTGCSEQQLRTVVLALGGFRHLYSLFLWPLSKPQSSSSASSWAAFPQMIRSKPARWGKDEVHLSLSLLSIRYYEKMNINNRSR
ncbi:hypothetical protein L6164_024616 [Bauhinia variegata]|uniref:Uncharacterized protein n=1 Tax=Bauhinia variegata TaxID=167791 RepID=A0ACB9LYD1_BAUVA|nr:hypothetical protein L6164_024616 [Bauhinia variegata]